MPTEKQGHSEGSTATESKTKTKRPSMFKVLLLNDDYTTMDFVVHVLQKFFNKSFDEANRIMVHVHTKGMGICGFYPFEIAETKVSQVVDYARKNEYPLQSTMEGA